MTSLNADAFKVIELEEQVRHLQRGLSMCMTQMRNAITDLEDDDVEGAIETLRQLVGDDV